MLIQLVLSLSIKRDRRGNGDANGRTMKKRKVDVGNLETSSFHKAYFSTGKEKIMLGLHPNEQDLIMGKNPP